MSGPMQELSLSIFSEVMLEQQSHCSGKSWQLQHTEEPHEMQQYEQTEQGAPPGYGATAELAGWTFP